MPELDGKSKKTLRRMSSCSSTYTYLNRAKSNYNLLPVLDAKCWISWYSMRKHNEECVQSKALIRMGFRKKFQFALSIYCCDSDFGTQAQTQSHVRSINLIILLFNIPHTGTKWTYARWTVENCIQRLCAREKNRAQMNCQVTKITIYARPEYYACASVQSTQHPFAVAAAPLTTYSNGK